MRRSRKTKIVATLGPSSDMKTQIHGLFQAGADVFRINMSHTNHDKLAQLVAHVRAVETDVDRPIAVLVDLQGPKLRLGKLPNGEVDLQTGTEITIVNSPSTNDALRLPVPHAEIFTALKPDARLLIDDGKIVLRVKDVSATELRATIVRGGTVKNNKGINLPGTVLPIPALTRKDRTDLDFALSLSIDWVALSFVQRPDDVAQLRKAVGGRAGVLAKIEKPSALACLDEIIELADAVMVARGDLGVELPLEEVPVWQKHIVRAARKAGKPVVVATQMLESMITSATPTRAEVSDVATAVFEGADAVMLSAETASGAYPVEAVAVMNRTAEAVEGDILYRSIIAAQRAAPEATVADALLAAVHDVTDHVQAAAIVCWTKTGSTGLRGARERPSVPILALTPIKATARRLTLTWGLHCVETEDAHDLDDVADRACRIAYTHEFAKVGDRIVVTAGLPLGTSGATNLLRVASITPAIASGD